MNLAKRTSTVGLFLAALTVASTGAEKAACCPFCPGASQTLTKDAELAAMILFGKLDNAKLDPNDPATGTTEMRIDLVVKSHPMIAGQKSITLPRYILPEKDTRFLVFCDVFQGKLDPYRGMAIRADSQIGEYLKGALAIKDKDATTRLRYFLKFLEDKDPEVSADAFNEFGIADYKEYRPVAEKADAKVIAAWIRDANTPMLRLGLYGSMIGHCGDASHAQLLRTMLDDSQRRYSSGVDGMLAGYILLAPKEGWAYLKSILADEKRDFLLRYAALRSARFFHEFRPDVIKPADVAAAVALLLDQKDIADLAIEDLRKWSCWNLTDRILSLYGRADFDVPIMKRAIVRFALSSQASNEKAAAFVTARKKEDAQWVEEVAELLRLENPLPAAAPSTAGKQ